MRSVVCNHVFLSKAKAPRKRFCCGYGFMNISLVNYLRFTVLCWRACWLSSTCSEQTPEGKFIFIATSEERSSPPQHYSNTPKTAMAAKEVNPSSLRSFSANVRKAYKSKRRRDSCVAQCAHLPSVACAGVMNTWVDESG